MGFGLATFGLAGALLGAAQNAARPGASSPPPVEEYFLAESIHPQRQGDLQVGWSFYRHRREGVRLSEVSLLFELGLADWLELEAELPWLRRRAPGGQPVTGLADLEVGLMFGVFRDPQRLAVSAGVEVVLPTGHERIVADRGGVEVEPFLIVGRALGRGEIQVGISSGVEEPASLRYDLATVYPIGSWRAVLEVNGEAGPGRPVLLVTPGLLFKPGRGFEIGVAVPLGMTTVTSAAAVVVKVTSVF